MKKLLFLILLIISQNVTPTLANNDETVKSAWITHPVVLDGKLTSSHEWSECNMYSFLLGTNDGIDPPIISAFIWVKNDETYLYSRFWIEWPKTQVDSNDQSFLYYLWETENNGTKVTNSDAAWIKQNGGSLDMCNYSMGTWVIDTFFGGTTDVLGYGKYDGFAYLYEFRKELNSNDGVDWTLQPGQKIGLGDPSLTSDKLVMGFLDKSSNTILQKPISLILAKDPRTRISVGGDLSPKIEANPYHFLMVSLSFLIITSTIVFIGLEIWRRKRRNQLVFYLAYKHTKLPETAFLGEDNKKNLVDIFLMISMSVRNKISNINNKISSRLANITIEDIKKYFETFDREMLPSILLSLIFICIVLAILLIITDSHIIEDIFYPYVVVPIINAIK